ncbi:MAG: hypothetical protein HN742_26575 [Lentisphaerae bacterium]|jgi:hypothetical protein|nr:hypothetical protein [Lentisphaerota bacterium]MBT4820236.1 hypothetical protein [Lentisphaerota bacterium]MBT5606029.1 hypothetical protein [Lentisphaerota bacterium]MBT7058582.1 hypothetical protein [Lentisphaerota bacterium]MBT7845468.1 hypothetical protein [Lentisphaerota bacterium]
MYRKLKASSLIVLIVGGIMSDAATTVTIFDAKQTVSPAETRIEVVVPPFSVEHQVRLKLDPRIDWPSLLGSNPWLRVAVNDDFLTKPDLLNKRDEFKLLSGLDLTWSKGDRWRVLYSPDFRAAIDSDSPYACPDAAPYQYVWDITPYVKPGKNTLRIQHLKVLQKPTTMIIRNASLEVGRALPKPEDDAVRPAPTGPLSAFVASRARILPITVEVSAGGSLTVGIETETFDLHTRSSLPGGMWHTTSLSQGKETVQNGGTGQTTWQTATTRFARKVAVRSDHVHIEDTITNRTDTLIGAMVENRLQMPGKLADVRIAGREAFRDEMNARNACHPSAFGRWGRMGMGLVAEDDVFRVHIRSFSEISALGLADPQLGLQPRTSVTLEWSIYPVPDGDYWDFVNAVRRNWGSNFTIPGPFCFGMHFPQGKAPEWYAQWMHDRDLNITAGGIAKYTNGRYAHGTGITAAPEFVAREKEWVSRMQAADPKLKPLCYFHAQCCTEPEAPETYADSKLNDANGEHLSYPYAYPLPLYLATRDNRYGKSLWRYVSTILDEIGAAGIYWDEMSHSVLEFTYDGPWDGVTVAIDPKTHAVTGKRSSVNLLMQSLRQDIVKHVRDRGKFLMANTQPATRTMLNEKVIRFVETGTYSALAGTHLGCPIGLGNHHPERNRADSVTHVRRLLEYATVYYGHYYREEPADWNFTSVMFPITPVELREGMVLGKERIHTARSGRFGWPDGSAATVTVVNGQGERVAEPNVAEAIVDGKHLYEIRIPSDHFAVLERR